MSQPDRGQGPLSGERPTGTTDGAPDQRCGQNTLPLLSTDYQQAYEVHPQTYRQSKHRKTTRRVTPGERRGAAHASPPIILTPPGPRVTYQASMALLLLILLGKAPCRDVAQPGRAPGSGPGGRWFKSSRPDHSIAPLRPRAASGPAVPPRADPGRADSGEYAEAHGGRVHPGRRLAPAPTRPLTPAGARAALAGRPARRARRWSSSAACCARARGARRSGGRSVPAPAR